MIFPKTILSFAFASIILVGCKDKTTIASNDEENTTSKKEIAAAVKPETASFKIEGMVCAIGCAKTIEKELSETNGVQKATVDFDKKEAVVSFDNSLQTPETLTKIVEATADGQTYKVSNMIASK